MIIMRSLVLSAAVSTWMAVSSIGPAAGAEPISARDFDQVRALVRPQEGEGKWDRIPWLSSLWEARRRAAAEGKPILLWEMDGHPLGCT
jgi:hypothetical protein